MTTTTHGILPTNDIAKDPAIQKAIDLIKRTLFGASKKDLASRYLVGAKVEEIRTSAVHEKYGKKAVATIARGVGLTTSRLYQYADVALTWDQGTFDEAAPRAAKAGLTFSHFVELAHDDRFKRYTRTGVGRPAGSCTHRTPIVSGLMRCGSCGGSMTILTRKTKRGVSYAQFGCVQHYSRGSSVCANNKTISEQKVTRALLAALHETLNDPETVKRFVDGASRRIAALGKTNGKAGEDAERRLRECERRMANLTETLAKLGWSDAVATKLKEEEATLGRLKAERAKVANTETGRVVPHPALIAEDFKRLRLILEADGVRGRELLARFVAPLVMTPDAENPDRSYRATGAFDLSFFLGPQGRGFGNDSCAGRI